MFKIVNKVNRKLLILPDTVIPSSACNQITRIYFPFKLKGKLRNKRNYNTKLWNIRNYETTLWNERNYEPKLWNKRNSIWLIIKKENCHPRSYSIRFERSQKNVFCALLTEILWIKPKSDFINYFLNSIL